MPKVETSRTDLSPFKEIDALLKCSLAPASFEYPLQEVKRQLNELLFKFNTDLQAVPLSYSNISFPSGKEYGRIMGELPTVHVDIVARLLVFQPEVGQSIVGQITKVRCSQRKIIAHTTDIVTQVTESHVALLVNGMFNASVSSEELLLKYSYNYGTMTW